MASPADSGSWASSRLRSSSASSPKSPQRGCVVISSSARSRISSAVTPSSHAALAMLDQLRDEMRLRRDRQLGMCVEHQAEQRRPRARDADHEGRGLAAVGTGPPPRQRKLRRARPHRAASLACSLGRERARDLARERALPCSGLEDDEALARAARDPGVPRRVDHRSARLRRDRRAALRHELVVRRNAPASGHRALAARQGGPLLRPLLAGRRARRHRRRVRIAVPSPAGADRR